MTLPSPCKPQAFELNQVLEHYSSEEDGFVTVVQNYSLFLELEEASSPDALRRYFNRDFSVYLHAEILAMND